MFKIQEGHAEKHYTHSAFKTYLIHEFSIALCFTPNRAHKVDRAAEHNGKTEICARFGAQYLRLPDFAGAEIFTGRSHGVT